ncbi:hypothetical protein RRF57_012136 [Xylaria bambusicola]|uniref:Uncharacterized protein n=1 Tax=Xylaria bambusicola TaxID=326684 RepID=A0AAN7V5B4_9PEZI
MKVVTIIIVIVLGIVVAFTGAVDVTCIAHRYRMIIIVLKAAVNSIAVLRNLEALIPESYICEAYLPSQANDVYNLECQLLRRWWGRTAIKHLRNVQRTQIGQLR